VDPYSWSVSLEALVLVPALAVAYAAAARTHRPESWRIACFVVGLALILFAFVTPLHQIALNYLLSAHLLQNVVLAEWAPALCVLGLAPALSKRLNQVRVVRVLTNPLLVLPLWLATYFLWHLPWAYDTALEHPTTLLHLEHLCYFVTGALVWWPVLTGRLSAAPAAAYLFAAFVLASPLGLLLALLPESIYDFYEHAPRLWGLSPLEDQQIAGVTMASEQAAVFFAAFTVYFLRFLSSEEAPVLYDRLR
jgi:cytochrome c oxidase assembly factor CtaG